jgi:hypothetical protein
VRAHPTFKRLDAPYTPGRPNSGGPQLKHKFYAFKESNARYQPVFLGVRKDVEVHECVLSQLKYKADDSEES